MTNFLFLWLTVTQQDKKITKLNPCNWFGWQGQWLCWNMHWTEQCTCRTEGSSRWLELQKLNLRLNWLWKLSVIAMAALLAHHKWNKYEICKSTKSQSKQYCVVVNVTSLCACENQLRQQEGSVVGWENWYWCWLWYYYKMKQCFCNKFTCDERARTRCHASSHLPLISFRSSVYGQFVGFCTRFLL